jgi:limonene-1,2-epoxide hydrolase
MSASVMSQFMQYFDRFEAALQTDDWSEVRASFAENACYLVEGVPFACRIHGRDAIVSALRKSTASFDATMDFRMLEVLSMVRLGPDRVRIELLSGYGRHAIGSMTAPVSMEVQADARGIVELKDLYDPELTAPALTWIATHLGDADPSYV